MTVKGADQILRNIGRMQVQIKSNRKKTLTAIMMTAKGHVMEKTPIDTAAFINSIDYQVKDTAAVLYFRGGFAEKTGFNFGLWLETSEDWKPTKKPAAGPHFMRDGFESPDALADIKAVIEASNRL